MTRLTTSSLLKAARTFNAAKAAKRGFGPARKFVIKLAGRVLPSKALVGMALGLRSSDFSGGRAHLAAKLAKLGIKLLELATVALIACSASKLSTAAAALELYTGDFFTKAAAFAARFLDGAAVLSAKHGLLAADDVVAPYDHKLGGHKLGGRREQRAWAAKVIEQLRASYDADVTTFVLFAGKAYAAELEASDLNTLNPLRGLGLGDRKGWLKAALAA
jgi:hypothetical protein